MRHFDLPVTRQSHYLCIAGVAFGFLLGVGAGWLSLILYLIV